MNTFKNRPLVRVNQQGCVRNLPEGRKTAVIGTWNVRTLKSDGKLKQLLSEMEKFKIDILGVSETHWNKEYNREPFEEDNYVIISSSRKDNFHRQGVEFANGLMNYNQISERILSIEIEIESGLLTIFQIYAPDSSYNDTTINMFYDKLQVQINKLPSKSRYLLMGDFNAKVGADSHINWPSEVRKFGLGTGNERGERLLQFCAINGLTVVNTLYKHKKCRLVTWISPDCVTRNQIDYCLVQRDSLKLVKNCRVYNSADIGSDHSLLMTKLFISSKRKKSYKNQTKRFDVEKLSDVTVAKTLEQNLGGSLEPLLNSNADVDELYERFKNITNEVTLQTVGIRKRKNVEGMPIETTELCNDRRKARLAMLTDPSTENKESFRKLNREVKNAVRRIKNYSLEGKVLQLEEHFQRNESHHLFKSVRELEGKPKKVPVCCERF